MPAIKLRYRKGRHRQKGIVVIFVLVLLAVYVSSVLSMLDMEANAMKDGTDIQSTNQARFLAESALQEGKYYAKLIDSNFSGTSAEQTVTLNGKTYGSYDYKIQYFGEVFTITGTGYIPNRTSPRVKVSLATQFTYDYTGVGIALFGSSGTTLSVTGNAQFIVQGGKILVNSTASNAVNVQKATSLSVPELDLKGGVSGPFSGTTVSIPSSTVIKDPFSGLPMPDSSTLPVQSASALSITGGTTILYPGVYTGGISVSGNANVQMMPGVYYIDGGGISLQGTGTISGDEVLIYNSPKVAGDQINIGGTGTLRLTAPLTGTYTGLTLLQPTASTNPLTVSGTGNIVVDGAIYAKSAAVTLGGNASGNSLGAMYVVNSIGISGSAKVTVNTQW